MKKCFKKVLKALFILQIFHLLSYILVMITFDNFPNFSISKFDLQILPNFSGSRGNQALKFTQLTEYNVENIFVKNHAENKAWLLIPDLFFFFKKALYKVIAFGEHLSINMFW